MIAPEIEASASFQSELQSEVWCERFLAGKDRLFESWMVSHSVTSHKDERGAAKQASKLTAAESVVPPASLRQKLDPQAHITIVDHDWWARHGAHVVGADGLASRLTKHGGCLLSMQQPHNSRSS